MQARIDRALAVLNGVLGDHLKRSGNALAIPMELIVDGEPVTPTREALADACTAATARVVVFVHGLMSTERTWECADGSSFGSQLARDLDYTPVYVRYNTGLHISDNGDSLDTLLEALVAAYPAPIEEICLIGHSMGGLVVRSATHAAATAGDRRWLPLVSRAIYLGTPHLGAPFERLGNLTGWVLDAIGNPYTKLVADIGKLRSSGIKDLRYANLRREDWEGVDADALLQNRRHPVPLLPHIRHYLVAASVTKDPRLALLFGDAVVPLRSAAGRSRPGDRSPCFPQEQVRVIPGLGHMGLTRAPEVYEHIRVWCEEEP
ncbi:lipase family alpha/beta hydrolase [Haliangium sp.]|uniref:lipase family alpha/beta hydrolase n=1 Tax=Haliangium sp. TaxID=2663208 RepID=UPI003D0FE270